MVTYSSEPIGFVEKKSKAGPRPGVTKTSEVTNAPVQPRPSLPTARVGAAIPAIVGKRRINDPNFIWFGNFTALYRSETTSTETKEAVPDELGTPYEQTVTTVVTTTYIYGYKADVAIGVCLGPGVNLTTIYYDDEPIWSGNIGPNRTQITLPTIDGSAISGCTLTWHGGAYDQTADVIITEADNPGYVGLAYCIIQGVRTDLMMGALSFEVSRYPNPLGLSGANNVIGSDINTVSALVEAITNEWGFASLNISNVDTVNFAAAAVTVKGENNACSVITSTGIGIKDVINLLQQQLYSYMYQDITSGKLKLNLVRPNNFNPNIVKTFGYSNIIDLSGFDKSKWSDTLSQLNGEFVSRANGYEPDFVLGQTSSRSQSAGRSRRSGDVSYPFAMTAAVANDLVTRDLGLVNIPRFKLSMVVNNDGMELSPGSIIALNYYKYEIYSVLLTVDKLRIGPPDNNSVIVQATQFIPGQIASFAPPAAPPDPDYSFDPAGPVAVYAISAPYWIARETGLLSSMSSKIASAFMLAIPTNSRQSSFDSYWYLGTSFNPNNIRVIENSAYPTYGKLGAAIDKYDGWTTGLISSLVIDDVVNPVNMRAIGNDGVVNGQLFLFIDDEILSFEGVTQTGPLQYTLTNVRRALLDTVASSHASAANCFITNRTFSNAKLMSPAKAATGLPQQWRFASNTINSKSEFSIAAVKDVANLWEPTYLRSMAPPRPHDTKITGTRNSTTVTLTEGETKTITWRTRSRLTTTVKLQTAAADASEISSAAKYQVHRVIVVDAGGAEYDCGATADTASANTLNITVPSVTTPGVGWLYVQAEITMNLTDPNTGVTTPTTLVSYFKDRLPVELVPTSPSP